MLDTTTAMAAVAKAPISPIEFVTIQLMPLVDGKISVSLIATTVDEEEPQLLDQEIAFDRVTTIEDAMTLVRSELRRIWCDTHKRKEH